ncbi:MAG: hypothetical protein ABFC67_00130 [Mizugakiibacter sp.]|uniref:hypothetical protein n=1 Tax=Mizugakiibacter sp. TaxID=1972610 RepID=UPI0031C769E7|nr:hypothetical protein [Xanthomonadaceae bacterium]
MREWLLRAVGVLEIVGGALGLEAALHRLLAVRAPLTVLAAAVAALFFAWALLAGVLLIAGSERGLRWSRWVQLLQVPVLSSTIASYAVHVGAAVLVLAGFAWPPAWSLHVSGLSHGWLIGVLGAAPYGSRIGVDALALLAYLVLRLAGGRA